MKPNEDKFAKPADWSTARRPVATSDVKEDKFTKPADWSTARRPTKQ
jgi:hypothetical protein